MPRETEDERREMHAECWAQLYLPQHLSVAVIKLPAGYLSTPNRDRSYLLYIDGSVQVPSQVSGMNLATKENVR